MSTTAGRRVIGPIVVDFAKPGREALGVDDGSDVVTWRYEQRRCKRGTGGLEVRIERRAAA